MVRQADEVVNLGISDFNRLTLGWPSQPYDSFDVQRACEGY
jgi:hypothetical protein